MRDEPVEKPENERAEEYDPEADDIADLDSEVPEADALEQHETVGPESPPRPPDLDREANEADVLEQSEEVGGADEGWE